MSLKPQAISPVPRETARVARAAYPKGNIYLQLRDNLGEIYHDEDFAQLFPKEGQPAYAPWRLALVSVMQCAGKPFGSAGSRCGAGATGLEISLGIGTR
jgi:transposase